MNRYTLHAIANAAAMKANPAGRWVEFSEAWPRIAQAQERTHRVRLELAEVQRQLAEVTAERDHYKRAAELADQLRNYERGM